VAANTWFDTEQNRALLAIGARKLISNIGIGAVIWGLINIGIGIAAFHMNPINAAVSILGALMLGTGIWALNQPTLTALLVESIMTALLLAWNIGITILNFMDSELFDPRGLIIPLIFVVVFFKYYVKLQHVKDEIASVPPEQIKATKATCKALMKKKLKLEPDLIQTTNKKCRAQLMDDAAFFIQRDQLRAFVAPKEAVREAILKPAAKAFVLEFLHPLGKLKYGFNKKNTAKLRAWLEAETPADEAPPPTPEAEADC
jgi:hypothetical protein